MFYRDSYRRSLPTILIFSAYKNRPITYNYVSLGRLSQNICQVRIARAQVTCKHKTFQMFTVGYLCM